MSTAHTEMHETTIVEHAFGHGEEAAALAHQLADCADCLAYAVGIIDQMAALHDLARSRLAEANPPALASLKRIDLLLDDAMVLLAGGSDPSGSGAGGEHTEKAGHGGRRSVPVGKE
ncbi:MAG TPA: hypothetical protein VML75_17060 [Kofleriaceae bacterium]|nr:hypothetical protein [Kofleriaceae bacterium]